jgi:ElaB/YqjD/DUF883 family membrane-anchored ribosome-binding protein
MIGVGLGWLIAGSRQSKQRSWSSGYRGQEYRGYGGYRGEYRGYGGSEYAGMPYASEQEEPGTMDRVKERASELGDDVKERAGELADRAKDVASDVADRAQNVASSVADQTRVQAHRLQDQYQESPLAMGAVSLALGIAAGLALPATDREISLVGDARDRVVDRARGVARETKDKVEHVAERVIDQAQTTAKQAAKEEGLTS